MDNSITEIREQEGNRKNTFPKFGIGKGMKKTIPIIQEQEGNEKIPTEMEVPLCYNC